MKITDTRAAFILLGLCIVAIAVLAGMGIAIPEVLVTLALVLAGIGGGATLPRPPAATELPQITPTDRAPAGGTGAIPRP
jgi:hypothetical protein